MPISRVEQNDSYAVYGCTLPVTDELPTMQVSTSVLKGTALAFRTVISLGNSGHESSFIVV